MIFARERLIDCWDELQILASAHYDEIGHYKDIFLDPDKSTYFSIEAANKLALFTARDEVGGLIGYNAFFISQSLHHKSSVQALQDLIYIDKNHRGFGSKFIEWCDKQLQVMGVQVVMQCLKAKHNHSKILERQGYELLDLVYSKRLDV